MLAGICLRTYPVKSLQNICFLFPVLPCTALLSFLSCQEKAAQKWQGADGAVDLSHWILARQADSAGNSVCLLVERLQKMWEGQKPSLLLSKPTPNKEAFRTPLLAINVGSLLLALVWLIPNTFLNSIREEGSWGCCVTNLLEAAQSCSSCAHHPSAGVFCIPSFSLCIGPASQSSRAVNPSPGRHWHRWAEWLNEDIRVLNQHRLPRECLSDPWVSDTAQHGFSSPCVADCRNQVS